MEFCTIKQLDNQVLAYKTAIEHNPNNVPLKLVTDQANPFTLAAQRGKLWKSGTIITVKFMSGGSSSLRQKIIAKAKSWEQYGNIKFNFVDSGNANIRIIVTNSGSSWSYIGTDHLNIPQNTESMEFGWLTDKSDDAEINRVVVHEFGHALGFIHEHQSPAAGVIPWDKEAVYKYYAKPPNNWNRATVDNNLFKLYEKTQMNYTDFDPKSIMLYAIPEELTVGNWSTGWNTQVSENDKAWMAVQYPGTVTPPSPNPPPNPPPGPNPPAPPKPVDNNELTFGKEVTASIGKPMEEDLFSFTVPTEAGIKRILLETSGNTDVTMALLDNTRTRVLAFDDNSGAGRNAKISKIVTAGQKYFVRIRHNNRNRGTGTYSIKLSKL